MTTIAYRDGVLAGDTLVCGEIKCKAVKVFALKRGGLVGGAGDLPSVLAFVDWLDRPKSEKPDLSHDDDFEALVISPDGSIEWYERTLRPVPIAEAYYAIGSGGPFAMGRMDGGGTAEDAVASGIRWDSGSGGEVVAVRLKGVK